jgi:hypothetical protein
MTNTTTEHIHVQRHSEDDDIFRTFDMGSAMGYAATELDISADHEHDMISVMGEVLEFEEAYRAWERFEAYANLVDNARNIHKQYTTEATERAPLYQSDDPETLAKLRVHADHVIEMINRDGPAGFVMWVCSAAECAPSDADSVWP